MKGPEFVLRQYDHFIEQAKTIDENETIFPRIGEDVFIDLCNKTIQMLQTLGPLLNIDGPLVIVGDIHGNLTDLLKIFKLFGMPPSKKYLFLGDYVDRGAHSIEVISILMSLVCLYPNDFFLIRGNHEFASVNRVYGFYDEALNSYGTDNAWNTCNDVFGYLPLAAVVSNSVFCVHGGLSSYLSSIQALTELKLPIDNYEEVPMISDLVWSDPSDGQKGFQQNDRGSGVLFGADALSNFLKTNKLKVLFRAHQCVAAGYSFTAANTCVTLFSSSNYCRLIQNKCGVIRHTENKDFQFFSLDNIDGPVKPKTTMCLATGQMLGLKQNKGAKTSLVSSASATSAAKNKNVSMGRRPSLGSTSNPTVTKSMKPPSIPMPTRDKPMIPKAASSSRLTSGKRGRTNSLPVEKKK